jgi:hypothetical protein
MDAVQAVMSQGTEAGLDAASRDDHEACWDGYRDDLRDIPGGA